ncbi:MAG: TolC family protein [Bacteroidota bacterium]
MAKIFIGLLIFLCLGFMPGNGNAQQVTLNSLQDALKLGFDQNPDYQNFLLNQEQAELSYKQSKSYRLPNITGSFNGQRNVDLPTTPLPAEIFGGEPGTTINTQFGQEYTYNAGININKQLFNRSMSLQSKLMKMSSEMVAIEKEQFQELLTQQISLYYYTALTSQKAISISKMDLETTLEISSLTKDRYEQGLIDLVAYNKALISENGVKQNLLSSEQLLSDCLTELKILMGMGLEDQLLMTEEITYELPALLQADQLNSNLKVMNAESKMNQADLNVKISQSALLPSLSINSYFGRQQFRDDFGLSLNSDSWSDYSYLSLNLSIPIFNGFSNRREIKKNKINYNMAQNDHKEAEKTAKLEDQLLIKQYQSGRREATLAEDNFNLTAVNEELTYQKYEEGLISLDAYLRVFEEYLRAESAYLNSISKLYNLYSQIFPRI